MSPYGADGACRIEPGQPCALSSDKVLRASLSRAELHGRR